MKNNKNHNSGNNLPWELISGSFTGSLTPVENTKLQKWLSASQKNLEEYGKMKKLWEEGLEDFPVYIEADETKAWNSFADRLHHRETITKISPHIRFRWSGKITAIAAVILLMFGVGWLLLRLNNNVFESTKTTGKSVVLKDGSSVFLMPDTRIKVLSSYNRNDRMVVLIEGEAYFETVHDTEKPFIVRLGTTQVKDLGTSFRIRKGIREINIDVITGKVEFSNTGKNESRLLVAGSKITYDIKKEQFGKITSINETSGLNFDNTPLREAIIGIRKVYHVKIVLADDKISDRRLTANLNGMDFPAVMEVLCRTLHLEYSRKDDSYVISDKIQEQQ